MMVPKGKKICEGEHFSEYRSQESHKEIKLRSFWWTMATCTAVLLADQMQF